MVWPACSMRTDTRRRFSRGSSEMQVSQSHAIEGTPVDVPVPRKVSCIVISNQRSEIICHLSFSIVARVMKSRQMTIDKYEKWKMVLLVYCITTDAFTCRR